MPTSFRSVTDPWREQRAGDGDHNLRAANMVPSAEQTRYVAGHQGQFPGQDASMLDRGANMLSPGASCLSGRSAML